MEIWKNRFASASFPKFGLNKNRNLEYLENVSLILAEILRPEARLAAQDGVKI